MLILVFIILVVPNLVFCDLNFSFASFDSNSCDKDGDFLCMGSAISRNGTLILTPRKDEQQANMTNLPFNLVGRVLYKTSVIAWPTSFSTTFTIRIENPDYDVYGDGMAFVFAQDDQPSPSQSFGSYMGILGPPVQGGVLRQLAVELDTYKNEYKSDPDGNHIAIDTVSIQDPVIVKSLESTGIDLKSGKDITVQIRYDGWKKVLQISVAYTGEPLIEFINQRIIMKKTVPKQVYIGFTGATGLAQESHHVINWNFTSSDLPEKSLKTATGLGKKEILLEIIIPVLVVLLILIVVIIPFAVRAYRKKKERKERHNEIENLSQNAANAPKVFKYSTLSKATKNFSKANLIGTGGFGSVYKGKLSNPPITIAVKKVSATSTQGEKEYLAEICTIGRLKHKNLVQLEGWCHDRDELLLVYDYMPNGSLDKYIGNASLDWEKRYKILIGLASVLVYLHEECGSPVVHRDVKPNNVMLDSDFNAHLGDFGLARLIRNDTSVTTMVAGTLGYLAPEVTYTGRATPESDVYSFGMVVLEVVCGTRSKGIMDENSLVNNVWESYEKGQLLKCVDKNLEGKFNVNQVTRVLMVGLACLHPGSSLRPTMRKVAQVFLNPDEPLMSMPTSRPLVVTLSFSSSTTNSARGETSTISLQSLPDERAITRNPSCSDET
ncbi:probable L-type lectin-domain containing receptor kinase S.5 [Tanacetum coccineum]